MSKGYPRGLARGEPVKQHITKQTFTARDLVVNVDGATGVGWGTTVLGGLPEGNIVLLGAVAYMQFTHTEASDPSATFDGDFGIGTTPASDGTITGDDVNIIPSTALGAATAKVSPRVRGVQADGAYTGVVLDNTDGSLELNLSLLIDDASIGADDIDFTADGELFITYLVLGDD